MTKSSNRVPYYRIKPREKRSVKIGEEWCKFHIGVEVAEISSIGLIFLVILQNLENSFFYYGIFFSSGQIVPNPPLQSGMLSQSAASAAQSGETCGGGCPKSHWGWL